MPIGPTREFPRNSLNLSVTLTSLFGFTALGDVRRLGDEGEEAHAAAAAGAGFDVDAEGSLEKLGPGAVARTGCLAGGRRTAGVGADPVTDRNRRHDASLKMNCHVGHSATEA